MVRRASSVTEASSGGFYGCDAMGPKGRDDVKPGFPCTAGEGALAAQRKATYMRLQRERASL